MLHRRLNALARFSLNESLDWDSLLPLHLYVESETRVAWLLLADFDRTLFEPRPRQWLIGVHLETGHLEQCDLPDGEEFSWFGRYPDGVFVLLHRREWRLSEVRGGVATAVDLPPYPFRGFCTVGDGLTTAYHNGNVVVASRLGRAGETEWETPLEDFRVSGVCSDGERTVVAAETSELAFVVLDRLGNPEGVVPAGTAYSSLALEPGHPGLRRYAAVSRVSPQVYGGRVLFADAPAFAPGCLVAPLPRYLAGRPRLTVIDLASLRAGVSYVLPGGWRCFAPLGPSAVVAAETNQVAGRADLVTYRI
jgi:hypothetical protein